MSRLMSSTAAALVVGRVVLKRVFKLAHELAVAGVLEALRRLALRIELQQLVGHVLHGLLHPRLGLHPLLRAQPVQNRVPAFGGAILLHQVEPGQRNIQPRPFGVFQNHELGLRAVRLRNLAQALVLANAVLNVHHVVAQPPGRGSPTKMPRSWSAASAAAARPPRSRQTDRWRRTEPASRPAVPRLPAHTHRPAWPPRSRR